MKHILGIRKAWLGLKSNKTGIWEWVSGNARASFSYWYTSKILRNREEKKGRIETRRREGERERLRDR